MTWIRNVSKLITPSVRAYSQGGNSINALIIGAPGSGKGTISNWIVRDFKVQHVSSGDLLRQHIKDGTSLGKEATRAEPGRGASSSLQLNRTFWTPRPRRISRTASNVITLRTTFRPPELSDSGQSFKR